MTKSTGKLHLPRKLRSQTSKDYLAANTVHGIEPAACWIWQGKPMSRGYGRIYVNQQRVLVHRFAYELAHGPIPEGFDVDHTCHNNSGCSGGKCQHRLCVNPTHLEAVPPLVNRFRSHRHGINKTHCKHGHEYTPANTRIYVKPGGRPSRRCRACQRDSNDRRTRRHREQATEARRAAA